MNVAQSTPMANEVLHAASTPPMAGPIMLPITLLDNGRREFIAGNRSSGTISGVIAMIAGVKTASKVPESTPKTSSSQDCNMPRPTKTTSTAVKSAHRVRDQ